MNYSLLFKESNFMSLVDIRNHSQLLNQLYLRYNLSSITSVGQLTDRLGDLYEDFVMQIFKDKLTAMSWQPGTVERYIVDSVLSYLNFTFNDLINLKSSNKGIPFTANNGMPKTDVYIKCTVTGGIEYLIPISVKQSTVKKVSFAEYSVSDIVSALNIQNPTLIYLLTKHQTDASAINFTAAEKIQLKTLLAPYVENLIRWCITLNPNPTTQDIRHPEYIIKFDLNHPNRFPNDRYCMNEAKVFSVDEYINFIRYSTNGILRAGGFGTGLSWTYATGSKGSKIQFKA